MVHSATSTTIPCNEPSATTHILDLAGIGFGIPGLLLHKQFVIICGNFPQLRRVDGQKSFLQDGYHPVVLAFHLSILCT